VILTEQVNRGQTVIEKFEREAGHADYVVVLPTGDDRGASAHDIDAPLQNIVATTVTMGLMTSIAVALRDKDSFKDTSNELSQDVRKLTGSLHSRARQNVILELGFFIGRLGRDQVCVLADPSVETPSDIIGVVTISTAENWKDALAKELRAANVL
jgi:predicted nucleotide-binding protein